jgi:glycosyltransferase involved in cell wall biosynthesis
MTKLLFSVLTKFSRIPRAIITEWNYIRIFGMKKFIRKILKSRLYKNSPAVSINELLKKRIPSGKELEKQKTATSRMKDRILFSIIMPVMNDLPDIIAKSIDSVINQTYGNWELIVIDDNSTDAGTKIYLNSVITGKIQVQFLEKIDSLSSALNSAANQARGEYLTFLNAGTLLAPHALFEAMTTISTSGHDIIYSDEDKITNDGTCKDAYFKPDYSPDMLLSCNYIGDSLIIERNLFNKLNGFREGFEGAFLYDILLRAVGKSGKIHHIKKILYHKMDYIPPDNKIPVWKGEKSAIESAAERMKIPGSVAMGKFPGSYRLIRKILNDPLVSIIIPFRDKPEFLQNCIFTIMKKSTYGNFEIIGVSNNSIDGKTIKLMKQFSGADPGIRFIEYNFPFNYSSINNQAANIAKGSHLLFLNNDIEIISEYWIEALLEHSQRPEVGAVGAKLYYPDDTIQHAGVIIGMTGAAGYPHRLLPRAAEGYFMRPNIIHNVTAVTAACMMVKKELFLSNGGFDEVNFPIAFNDIDFCLRLMQKGYLNVFTPYCEAYHHESASRGTEDTGSNMGRFIKEVSYFKKRHRKLLKKGDPYYNPNLSCDECNFDIRYV